MTRLSPSHQFWKYVHHFQKWLAVKTAYGVGYQ